jgi:hypothetical protein
MFISDGGVRRLVSARLPVGDPHPDPAAHVAGDRQHRGPRSRS